MVAELSELLVYQTKQGKLEFTGDLHKETLWANLQQVSSLFERDKSVVSRHIKNIFKEKELDRKSVVALFATTAADGKTYQVEYFNLDLILSVGYRVNSKTATKFRQWATKTLRQHIIKGYTINTKQLKKNYDEFLQAVDSVKTLLPNGEKLTAENALELIKLFADTWLSLNAFDSSTLPTEGLNKAQVRVRSEELLQAIAELKTELLNNQATTQLFAQEKQDGSVDGIMGNIFQSVFDKDVYQTVEEKAAHLLYFFVKNHPFTDGNKRSGAFAFIWFLNKAKLLRKDKISPQALTALTLLVAESDPKDKDRVIGLILLLLRK